LNPLQAFLIEKDDGSIDMVGNRTEGALLMLLRGWGRNYKTVRANRHEDVAQLYGFSSAKKMASVMLKTDSGLRLYNKVLLLRSRYLSCNNAFCALILGCVCMLCACCDAALVSVTMDA